ncbi:hypothetical protein ACFLQN_04525 [Candidatus Aenigmatarchaeota archaeon]
MARRPAEEIISGFIRSRQVKDGSVNYHAINQHARAHGGYNGVEVDAALGTLEGEGLQRELVAESHALFWAYWFD